MGDESKELPSQVFELFHFRYLTLICSSNVPSAISNLVNLQTLIILPTSGMLPNCNMIASFGMLPVYYTRKRHWREGRDHFSLPSEIWRMQQLRHLVLYDLYMLPHPSDGSNPSLPLENLQTLPYIKDLVWTEKILQMIPNVISLGLVYQMEKRYHLHLLKHLHQLEKLKLYGLYSFSWMEHITVTFPRILKKLTLVGGEFPWEDMSIIGSLPNLQVLKLRDQCFGKTWETADGEFPELRYLLIEGSGLECWITESSHFPRLKCLVLSCCQDLREIPQDMGEIPLT
ncbi:putative late blight resistance protein homolog R1B-14 [Salvia hispanica]|uniref:putative late blight resistance protein homolog R1B-14 n=1 Tax=Salvia hispanica TaxID=49212 RepID=UPI0020093EB2|nr:putative late blight resistance protein homolog R1B-14 [Salvia hispanica]